MKVRPCSSLSILLFFATWVNITFTAKGEAVVTFKNPFFKLTGSLRTTKAKILRHSVLTPFSDGWACQLTK